MDIPLFPRMSADLVERRREHSAASAVDREIEPPRRMYQLYGLTDEEIKVVEGEA